MRVRRTAPTPKVKGPLVWIDMDQQEIDNAYHPDHTLTSETA